MRGRFLQVLCAACILLIPAGAFCQGFLPLSLDPALFQSLSSGVAHLPEAGVQLLQAAPPNPKTPEPYKKEEFPQWLQDLWRGGVIFIGSLPFTYFYTLESYDMFRYVKSGFNFTQAPWPFRPGAEITYTSTEQLWLIVTTVGLSALITGVDFLIDQLSRSQ